MTSRADGVRFFVDRSLGDHVVPDSLRDAGWVITTMRERYGVRTAEELSDVDWIRDSSAEGEVLLTGDKAIAKRPLEVAAVIAARARVFALGSNQLTGVQKAARFLTFEVRLFTRAVKTPGPYVVSMTGSGLETLTLHHG